MKKIATHPVVLLVLGLTLGVGTGVGWFWMQAAPLVKAARLARHKATEATKPEAPWDFWTEEMKTLARELQEEKDALKKREDELARREARFAAERQELMKERKELQAMQADIAKRVTEISVDEVRNLKTLANTYSNLSPKALITIFKEMDDASVVKILALMKTDVVSPLFEEMTKQAQSDPALAKRIAQLSEKLRFFRTASATAQSP